MFLVCCLSCVACVCGCRCWLLVVGWLVVVVVYLFVCCRWLLLLLFVVVVVACVNRCLLFALCG